MPHQIWHIAFAASDLDVGMDEMADAFSLTWRPVREFKIKLTDEAGRETDVAFRGTFSNENSPAVEIFQAVPGTPLAQFGQNPFHHMGYWVSDRPTESRRLTELGWPCFASAEPPAHRVGLNIHRGAVGVGAELCDSAEDRPELRDLFPSV